MLVDDLRALFLFDSLSDEQIAALASLGEEIAFEEDTILFREGDPADHWWVLIEGRIDLLRRSGNEIAPYNVADRPGVWAGGFQAWSPAMGYLSTGRGATPGRVFRVPSGALADRVGTWFPFCRHLIEGLFQNVRQMEAHSRQRERLVALGTMAAGLAHEINNPASAVARGIDALDDVCTTLVAAPPRLLEAGVTAEQLAALEALARTVDPSAVLVDPLAMADREDALGTWLDERGLANPWELAATLASLGVEPAWCERVAQVVEDAAFEASLEWLTASLASSTLIAELRDANRRVSDLVSVMKEQSQVDRASLQLVDVTTGIESTLVLLAHRLRGGINIERDFTHGATRIEADAGALNQVWMNLILNAIDAIDGAGTIRIATRVDPDRVVVEIVDSGAGMSPEAQARAFEPFFTTKDVGKGTGLGLDISRRIVVERHHGEIEIESEPGNTVLRVVLPRRQP